MPDDEDQSFEPKTFEVTVTIRNNLLKARRVEAGLAMRDVAAVAHIQPTTYGQYEAMKLSPLNRQGEWRETAKRLAEYWHVTPEVLWPGAVLAIEEVEASRTYGEEEFGQLMSSWHQQQLMAPDELLEQKTLAEECDRTYQTLTPREEKVLRARFEDDQTLEEATRLIKTRANTGKLHPVSRERIRSIEAKALRKLRHPSRSKRLKFGGRIKPTSYLFNADPPDGPPDIETPPCPDHEHFMLPRRLCLSADPWIGKTVWYCPGCPEVLYEVCNGRPQVYRGPRTIR